MAFSVVAGLAMAQAVSAATILDSVTGLGNSSGVPETYGSNLAGTPDIALDWGSGVIGDGWDSYLDWDGRGESIQTDFGQVNPMSVVFTPGSGTIGVQITSFDLDEWAGGGDSVVSWAVKNGATTIVSGTWNDYNDLSGLNGGRSTVNTGMTVSQAEANAGSALSLELTFNSGSADFLAMDNLSFDQVVVPEPSSTALAALGLGAMAMRRRRK